MTFLSTPSARRATVYLPLRGQHIHISIHALCEEGDIPAAVLTRVPCDFYPRPLRGGRPSSNSKPQTGALFLSTPSARRATHSGRHGTGLQAISIHALCEEGDEAV